MCQGWGEGMRRGLNGAGEWVLYYTKIKQNKQTETTPWGKNRTAGRLGKAGQGTARQGRTGHDRIHSGTFDDEPARDCKHKEIIKGANEEGNEINTGGAN